MNHLKPIFKIKNIIPVFDEKLKFHEPKNTHSVVLVTKKVAIETRR